MSNAASGPLPRSFWRAIAFNALHSKAETGLVFQANDLARDGVPEPDSHHMWARLFADAHRLGVIEQVGSARSTRRTTCGSLVWLWRGTADVRRDRGAS